MQSQLTEMQLTRNLQIQPLPFPKIDKSEILAPNFFGFPQDRFEKLHLVYTIKFEGNIENLGNSPAVSIDIFATITCIETRGSRVSDYPLCLEDQTVTEKKLLYATISSTIECLPLKGLGPNEITCIFADGHALIGSLSSQKITRELLQLTILYKNLLGASFRLDLAYDIILPDEEKEKVKLTLKAMESAKIDFAKELAEYDKLISKQTREKARELSKKMRKSFPAKYKLRDISLRLELTEGSFLTKHISEEEYAKELARKTAEREEALPLVHVVKG